MNRKEKRIHNQAQEQLINGAIASGKVVIVSDISHKHGNQYYLAGAYFYKLRKRLFRMTAIKLTSAESGSKNKEIEGLYQLLQRNQSLLPPAGG